VIPAPGTAETLPEADPDIADADPDAAAADADGDPGADDHPEAD
jgi:hypothetical protein